MQSTKRYAYSFKPTKGQSRIREVHEGYNMEGVLSAAKQKTLAKHPEASGFLIVGLDHGR